MLRQPSLTIWFLAKWQAIGWVKGSCQQQSLPTLNYQQIIHFLVTFIKPRVEVNKNNALGHYVDWATPTMLTTLNQNVQLLMANKVTPAQLTENLDKDYQKYLATLTHGLVLVDS
ncbi:hypothetical protein P4S72_23845 [Vibrio sp. PP-XX7]